MIGMSIRVTLYTPDIEILPIFHTTPESRAGPRRQPNAGLTVVTGFRGVVRTGVRTDDARRCRILGHRPPATGHPGPRYAPASLDRVARRDADDA